MSIQKYYYYYKGPEQSLWQKFKKRITAFSMGVGVLSLIAFAPNPVSQPISPLSPLAEDMAKSEENNNEVFGFAPYWTFDNLDNVNFSVLTTLAYFDVGIDAYGNLDTHGPGYSTFTSDKATELFRKAHENGTRVVLTITQMDNQTILSFLDNPDAQNAAIRDVVDLVDRRGIDGINVDFEYFGNPGNEYKEKFSTFVENISREMHSVNPSSKVTVSVYASAVKDPKIYDIGKLSDVSDGIFMMAYDFATSSSDEVIPTSPLYGHKEGKYWYDVSTAVEDFLTQMPSDKLILGVPWYGYEYPVYEPGVKVARHSGYYSYYWRWGYRYSTYVYPPSYAQTYANAQKTTSEASGWDDLGKVSWRAYVDGSGVWRMMFLDDPKSLEIKYQFAKEKDLAGVGIWALGFDTGVDMWAVLQKEFGAKFVDSSIQSRKINETI